MVVPPTALNLLRSELRQRRQEIAGRTNFPVSENPLFIELIAKAERIGLYLPMGGEPDAFPLVSGFIGVTALPMLTKGNPMMTFRQWSVGDPVVAASLGVQQPVDTAAICVPNLILVPLLGFDAACNRIGQGGGYYDRYLAAHPVACRIGIAWEGQRIDRIAAQPWDVPMDAIITEAGFYIKDLNRCQHL